MRLTDKNVKCPKFPFTEYFASIQENSPPETIVLPNLIAEDVEKFEKVTLAGNLGSFLQRGQSVPECGRSLICFVCFGMAFADIVPDYGGQL